MSLGYFLPLRLSFAKNYWVRQFQSNVRKTRKHVSKNIHSAFIFPNVSQFCHTGILTRIRACEQWPSCEHEQASTHLKLSNFGSLTVSGKRIVFYCDTKEIKRDTISLYETR